MRAEMLPCGRVDQGVAASWFLAPAHAVHVFQRAGVCSGQNRVLTVDLGAQHGFFQDYLHDILRFFRGGGCTPRAANSL